MYSYAGSSTLETTIVYLVSKSKENVQTKIFKELALLSPVAQENDSIDLSSPRFSRTGSFTELKTRLQQEYEQAYPGAG
jgi:hypothetical protein